MKKVFLIFLIGIFLLSLVSASSCSEPDYQYCYEGSNSDPTGELIVNSKVFTALEDENGNFLNDNDYAIGNLYFKSGAFGSGFGANFVDVEGYVFYNKETWDDVWNSFSCNENGCEASGYSHKVGYKKLASLGERYTDCPMAVGITFGKSDYYWIWSGSANGWRGNGDCLDIKVVECQEDSDCSGDLVCDTSDNWENWRCVEDVECNSNLDCPITIITEKSCLGDNLIEEVTTSGCVDTFCVDGAKSETNLLEECEFGCGEVEGIFQCLEEEIPVTIWCVINGECVERDLGFAGGNCFNTLKECEDDTIHLPKPNVLLYVSIGIFLVLLLIGGIIYFTRR